MFSHLSYPLQDDREQVRMVALTRCRLRACQHGIRRREGWPQKENAVQKYEVMMARESYWVVPVLAMLGGNSRNIFCNFAGFAIPPISIPICDGIKIIWNFFFSFFVQARDGLLASGFRLLASGDGLIYIRVNVKALVTGSITKLFRDGHIPDKLGSMRTGNMKI